MAQLIDHSALSEWVSTLHPDWLMSDSLKQISRNFTFKDFYQTMAFANSVAWVAHQYDHHPEMQLSYKNCLIKYSTHSVGGLTELDFNCARAIDQLVEQ